jgi:hypothetical protein
LLLLFQCLFPHLQPTMSDDVEGSLVVKGAAPAATSKEPRFSRTGNGLPDDEEDEEEDGVPIACRPSVRMGNGLEDAIEEGVHDGE